MKSGTMDVTPPWDDAPTLLLEYPRLKEWYANVETVGTAAYNLGILYHRHIENFEKAAYCHKKAYDFGHLDSALQLGILYQESRHFKLAIQWFETAAAQNHKTAAYNLGVLYEEELGDYTAAVRWYEKAYELGYINAARELGHLYAEEFGDAGKALQWFEAAARHGVSEAINNAGCLYYSGLGDVIRGAAFVIALLAYGKRQDEIMDWLKNDWKLDRALLEKAYKLQLTLDIPRHYTGGIDGLTLTA